MTRVTTDEIRRYLEGIIVPATPDTVVEHARHRDAPDEVIQCLERLPMGEWHSIDRIVERCIQVSDGQIEVSDGAPSGQTVVVPPAPPSSRKRSPSQ